LQIAKRFIEVSHSIINCAASPNRKAILRVQSPNHSIINYAASPNRKAIYRGQSLNHSVIQSFNHYLRAHAR
ncbi:MAG: hypothetical protein WBA17_00340, partial [Saprospiraceae bacterium]